MHFLVFILEKKSSFVQKISSNMDDLSQESTSTAESTTTETTTTTSEVTTAPTTTLSPEEVRLFLCSCLK